jgi:glycine oxidase
MNKDRTIVIGGGVIGLSTTWRLAQRGRSVMLLEAGKLGGGASGVPWAALWPSAATKKGVGHRLHRQSLERYPNFLQELTQETGVTIEYQRIGRIEVLAHDARRQAASREAQTACQEWPTDDQQPIQRIVTGDELRQLEPAIADAPLGGLLCNATAYVATAPLISALSLAAHRAGASIHEQTPVVSLDLAGDRVIGVKVEGESLAAGAVLIAAGARSSTLHPLLAQRAPVVPIKGQVLVLRPAQPSLRRLIKQGKTYLFPTETGDVLIGATSEPEAEFDTGLTDNARDYLRHCAANLVPSLADAQVVRQWAGHRPQAVRRRPFLGPVPGVAGLFLSTGHFKIGVAMAPIVGELATSLLMNEPIPYDLTAFMPPP